MEENENLNEGGNQGEGTNTNDGGANENDENLGLQKGNSGNNQQGDNEGQEDNPPADEVVPENYDFKDVKLPNGMELDKDLTSEFSGIAKEMGLSQGKADKLMGMGVKLSTKLQEKFETAIKENQENQIKAYKTMLNTDPEIGGANLKQTLLEANVAYDTFVSDEAAALLQQVGLNNHPAIVKVFRDIGKQLKNDSIKGGGQNNAHTRTAADWYPEMNNKK